VDYFKEMDNPDAVDGNQRFSSLCFPTTNFCQDNKEEEEPPSEAARAVRAPMSHLESQSLSSS